jgi:hypothetical protein
MIAHDIFAETNPAFCAHVLVAFTTAFQETWPAGPEAPLAYLALPLVISNELAQTFDGTNRNTGLPVWLDRNPGILIDLASRVDASLDIVTEGLRFGCFSQVLSWQGAHILRGPAPMKKVTSAGSGEAVAGAMKRAERIGYWLAAVGSQRAVFGMMGLTV